MNEDSASRKKIVRDYIELVINTGNTALITIISQVFKVVKTNPVQYLKDE